jgi:Fe-S cluster assembly protein SufD
MTDKIIQIDNKENMDISIQENTNLLLIFEQKHLNKQNINLNIKENVVLNLTTFHNSKTSQNQINITSKSNSTINHNQIILQTKKQQTNTILENNSKYTTDSINYSNNSDYKTNNKSIHKKNNATTTINIKNIATNNSKITSDATITIPKNSNNSVGHQNIKGIILDETSQIITSPNLQIQNNNINCSHSASITQIDEKHLFYLNTRGLNKKEALNIIIQGHFQNTINKIKSQEHQKIIINKLKEQKII